jgi:hypothetical protein
VTVYLYALASALNCLSALLMFNYALSVPPKADGSALMVGSLLEIMVALYYAATAADEDAK